MSIQDALSFIRKQNKILGSWTDDEIVYTISYAISCGTFYYSVSETGEINGVVIAGAEKNRLHVYGILTTEPRVFQRFVRLFNENFKGYTLSAYRRGEYREYSHIRELCNTNF